MSKESENSDGFGYQFCRYCSLSLPFRGERCGICNNPHKRLVTAESVPLFKA